jgi:hypothetical protein
MASRSFCPASVGRERSLGPKVDVDWNRNIDFSKFKTYAWIESKHPGKGLWNQRIIDGIGAKLAKAGLKKSGLQREA